MVVSVMPTYVQPAKDDERGVGWMCVGLHDSTGCPKTRGQANAQTWNGEWREGLARMGVRESQGQ